MKSILKSRDGYILAYVILIFLVIALVSSIIFSFAIMSTASTEQEYKEQQVYYTAKSAAASVAQYVMQHASDTGIIDNLTLNEGQGSITNMGNYAVQVTKVGTEKIKIKATATYKGEASTVSVTLVKTPSPSGIIPTDNVIFVNGDGNGFGQCNINGNIYVDGNLTFSNGSEINGFVVVKGTTTIENAGNTTKGVFSFGSVNLLNGSVVNGDLFTKGDLYMSGAASINKNAYADGSLTSENSATIYENAVIGNNASFSGGSNRIRGTLTYGGTVSCAWGSITDFVPLGATKTTSYVPIDESPYGSQVLPSIPVPTQQQMPELYNTAALTNNNGYRIENSGTITQTVVNQLNALSYGSTVTIDARSKDINLLLNNTSLNLSNGLSLEVYSENNHNVFIYMTGNSSISVNANEYIGMKVRSTNPRLFIIGDGAQSVYLNNNSELDACVYMPNGTISASGSNLTTYKFVGACIVKNALINNDVLFHYSKPNLEGTPLAVFQNGQNGSGGIAWLIESWGKQ